MTRQLDLFGRLSYYEGPDIEYKSARGGLPGDLWETYSAFANSEGGTIWLGVGQKDGKLVLHGLENPEKLVGELWSLLNNRNKVSRNLLKDSDVSIVPLSPSRNSLISIRVPKASRRERPIYVGPNPATGAYRRNYEGDYHCTEDEVRRMFADQLEDEPADSRILEGFTWDDLHPESVQQFRNRFRSVSPDHAWLKEDDRELLSRLGGWRVDRRARREGLTVAGLLMFGKMQAVLAPEAIPGFHLDYRERLADDPAIRWSDRLTVDGSWEANLFQFYQRVLPKLSSGPGIKVPFQRDSEGYRRLLTPVHEALQESLVNALIHADYGGKGGVVIDCYPDRIVLSNPGTLLLSREQISRGGVSECRNKSLQRMFQMLGVGDKAGSGIDKIRSAWQSQHWQSPRLRETHQPDRVELVLSMVSTLPTEITHELDRRFGKAFRQLGPDEVQTLVLAEIEGEITNQRLQESLLLHRVDITHLLRDLVNQGFLRVDGVGRGTRYFPRGQNQGVEGANPGGSPPILFATPPDLDEDPVHDPRLIEIAKDIRGAGKAPSAEHMRDIIIALCQGRYLRLRELSILLDRSPETLRDSYVSKLVKEGRLLQKYQDNPSHRDQAYTTAASVSGPVQS